MARVLIFWTHPRHLSVAEADAWAHAELRQVTGLAAVERTELTRLRSASEHFGSPYDWMLELHLAPGADTSDLVDSPACGEWLSDLRLLGMHPVVIAVVDCQPRQEGRA